MNSRKPHSEF